MPLAPGLVEVVADVVYVSSQVAVPTLSAWNDSIGFTYRLSRHERGERGFESGQVDEVDVLGKLELGDGCCLIDFNARRYFPRDSCCLTISRVRPLDLKIFNSNRESHHIMVMLTNDT